MTTRGLVLLLALATCDVFASDSEAKASRMDRFVPRTHTEGGRTRMPLVFPDGTRAAVTYPRRLDLAGLGLVPSTSGTLPGGAGRDFLIAHADRDALATRMNGGWPPRVRATYPGAAGRVPLYDLDGQPDQLGFQLGPWAVFVWDRLTPRERTRWARNLTGATTAGGFLRLRATGRLRLARAGTHAGPQLELGDLDGRHVALTPGPCRLAPGETRRVAGRRVAWRRGSRYAIWCLSPRMSIQARGRPPWIRAAIRGVRSPATHAGAHRTTLAQRARRHPRTARVPVKPPPAAPAAPAHTYIRPR